MSLMLRLQIGALVIAVLTGGFVIQASAAAAPAPNVDIAGAVYALFILWWIGSIAFNRLRGVTDDSPAGWYHHTIRVFWLGNLVTLAAVWLILPYAEEGLQLVTALFVMGPAVIEIMGTVRPPRFGPPGKAALLAPVVIPAGMILFLAVHGGRWAGPVIAFVPALVGVLLLLRHFLQRSLANAEAARRQAELERDARVRFLAAASHDLSQPLQSARLFLDRAMRDPNIAERAAANRNAQASLGAMERLVQQMLDHLRFQVGAVSPRIRDVPVASLLVRVATQFEPIAEMAEARLRVVRSSAILRADVELTERAISNLVDNALRHSGCRRVLTGLTRRQGKARLWVIDDGAGIAAADQAGLFQEFVQGDWQDGREHGGFGLGLASVKRYCGIMGGSAGLEPRWCKGAAFFIELPLARASAR